MPCRPTRLLAGRRGRLPLSGVRSLRKVRHFSAAPDALVRRDAAPAVGERTPAGRGRSGGSGSSRDIVDGRSVAATAFLPTCSLRVRSNRGPKIRRGNTERRGAEDTNDREGVASGEERGIRSHRHADRCAERGTPSLAGPTNASETNETSADGTAAGENATTERRRTRRLYGRTESGHRPPTEFGRRRFVRSGGRSKLRVRPQFQPRWQRSFHPFPCKIMIYDRV